MATDSNHEWVGTMEEHNTYSVAFKRQMVREYFAGVKLYSLARRHNLSLATIRTWVDEHFHRSAEVRDFRTLTRTAREPARPGSAALRPLNVRMTDRPGFR